MILGEGAGAVLLERLDFAKQRGATILAEVVGHSSSTVMDRDGTPHTGRAIGNVLTQSMKAAGLGVDELGHVHAHGLSTRKGDAEEAAALAEVIGEKVPVTAAKSYFGNLGAGSGVVELICSVLAMNRNQMVPILNYEIPDPECPIRAATADDSPGDSFINVNVTPQGQAAAIAIARYR